MPKDRRQRVRKMAGHHVVVAVADARRHHADEHLPFPGRQQFYLLHFEWGLHPVENGRPDSH
jgi:hypothetical protein